MLRVTSKNEGELKIEYVPLDQVQKWPRNPKNHDLDTLEKSILRFGFVQPVIVDGKSNRLVAGHGRLEALLRMRQVGLKPPHRIRVDLSGAWLVPVISGVKFESEADAEAYLIADNRLVELGGWDEDLLKQMSQDILSSAGYLNNDFQLNEDLISMMNSMGFVQDSKDIIEDEPLIDQAEELQKKWKVKLGDIWKLGSHFLMCGDSGEVDDVKKLFGKNRCDCLFTSPPYNIGILDKNYGGDNKKTNDYFEWLRSICKIWIEFLGENRSFIWNIGVYINTVSHRHVVMLEDIGLSFVRQFVWKKVGVAIPSWRHTVNNPVARNLSSNFVHEMVYVMSKGDLERGGNVLFDDTLENDVFFIAQSQATVDVPSGLTKPGGTPKCGLIRSMKAHPAVFPIKLPCSFLQHYTAEGEIVCEPFSGSGTTIMACEKLKRTCRAMELSPNYVAISLERWLNVTKEPPKRLK
jgi:DNA modification methylase